MSEGKSRMRSAARHDRVRRQHSDELAEDYVEAIADLLARTGQSRVTDLQRIFGVSHVSVIRALKRIEDRELVHRSGDGGWHLTASGESMAKESGRRHELVLNFLRALGVSDVQAEADAEGMEHHLSKETLEAMRRFLADIGK